LYSDKGGIHMSATKQDIQFNFDFDQFFYLERIVALLTYDIDNTLHSLRVGELLYKFLLYLGYDEIIAKEYYIVGVLHDIGKLQIPKEVLQKEGKLSNEEWQLMKRHTEYGLEELKGYEIKQEHLDVILYHHENYNGTGYPHNLVGEEIPLIARVLRIIDSYDAMNNDRCYRKKIDFTDTLEEIIQCANKFYDPYLTEQFIKFMTE